MVLFTNNTRVKCYMATQAYKVVNIHDHEILRWENLSIILHTLTLHIEGMHGGIQSELSTLALNNW